MSLAESIYHVDVGRKVRRKHCSTEVACCVVAAGLIALAVTLSVIFIILSTQTRDTTEEYTGNMITTDSPPISTTPGRNTTKEYSSNMNMITTDSPPISTTPGRNTTEEYTGNMVTTDSPPISTTPGRNSTDEYSSNIITTDSLPISITPGREINECDAGPCENNGTCDDRVNDYFCRYKDGFTGKNCSDEIGCPETIGYRYVQHLNLCFLMDGSVSKGIEQAKATCTFHSAHLITINSSEVQTFLINEIYDRGLDTARFFIDGNDEESEGIWKSSTGDVMTYTALYHTEPNGREGQNCLAMGRKHQYEWSDVECERTRLTGGYICQIDIT